MAPYFHIGRHTTSSVVSAPYCHTGFILPCVSPFYPQIYHPFFGSELPVGLYTVSLFSYTDSDSSITGFLAQKVNLPPLSGLFHFGLIHPRITDAQEVLNTSLAVRLGQISATT